MDRERINLSEQSRENDACWRPLSTPAAVPGNAKGAPHTQKHLRCPGCRTAWMCEGLSSAPAGGLGLRPRLGSHIFWQDVSTDCQAALESPCFTPRSHHGSRKVPGLRCRGPRLWAVTGFQLGIQPRNPETPIQKNLYKLMSTAALFTTAGCWTQPKRPFVNE